MMNSPTDRRGFPRRLRSLPLSVHHPGDSLGLAAVLRSASTLDVGGGGLRFATFGAVPFGPGDSLLLRIHIPSTAPEEEPLPASILGPTVVARARVLRIERHVVADVAGFAVAVEFEGRPDVRLDPGLTLLPAAS